MFDPAALHRYARALARRRGHAEHADDFAQWLALASLTRTTRALNWELIDFLRELGGDFRREENRAFVVPLDEAHYVGALDREVVFTEDVSLLFSRAGLTARESEAVRRHFWQGESYVEIGEAFGITGAGAQLCVSRAARKLRGLDGKLESTY